MRNREGVLKILPEVGLEAPSIVGRYIQLSSGSALCVVQDQFSGGKIWGLFDRDPDVVEEVALFFEGEGFDKVVFVAFGGWDAFGGQ